MTKIDSSALGFFGFDDHLPDCLLFLQGKVKAKVLSSVTQSLSSPDQYLTEELQERRPVSLAELKDGTNPGCVVIVGVACVVPFKERVP